MFGARGFGAYLYAHSGRICIQTLREVHRGHACRINNGESKPHFRRKTTYFAVMDQRFTPLGVGQIVQLAIKKAGEKRSPQRRAAALGRRLDLQLHVRKQRAFRQQLSVRATRNARGWRRRKGSGRSLQAQKQNVCRMAGRRCHLSCLRCFSTLSCQRSSLSAFLSRFAPLSELGFACSGSSKNARLSPQTRASFPIPSSRRRRLRAFAPFNEKPKNNQVVHRNSNNKR